MARASGDLPRMSFEEFLRFEGEMDVRYELYQGKLVAMAPPHGRHGRIAQSVGNLLDRRSSDPDRCMAYQGAGLVISENDATYLVPDVIFACTPPDRRGLMHSAVIIVEILSPSTALNDFRTKVPIYQGIDGVQEIWLVDAGRRWVQRWRRHGQDWIVALPVTGEDSFHSEALDARVALDELYAGVRFEEESG
ncbi:MAG TPA: Uma2 family endonuclease [Geminicoccus sp.]|uniref:Uma2 family endonuclease n=1 Tax=Geminicoccus sp. TaxID=2024832 RepID=UPI002CCD5AF7|nr:Uma2 family endonuclease [Geminicoccus sp.]HWL70106.1 Uma2 family endonuclease [Geminicoccus sp.]